MSTEQVRAPGTPARPAELLHALRTAWPPTAGDEGRGYRPLALRGTAPLAARALTSDPLGIVAVVAYEDGATAALPLVADDDSWRVAIAGDGLAARLVGLAREDRGQDTADGFELTRFRELPDTDAAERGLTADQSNRSVVVGESVLVKWRTAVEAGGDRATWLRRHLAAVGYTGVPALLAVLRWHDGHGHEAVLADLDGYLPGAEDGWDEGIAALLSWLGDGPPSRLDAEDLAPRLGRLTAQLHLAFRRSSDVIPEPCERVGAEAIGGWVARGRAAVDHAVGIEAPDRSELLAQRADLMAAIDSLATVDETTIQPIHGDLHIGQLVVWRDGLAIIDLDGPPGERGSGWTPEPTARDVAQLLVALENLAAVVDRRTERRRHDRLRGWASDSGPAFLSAYQHAAADAGQPDLLDTRLLGPFIAEQLCRELIYADAVLPRWREAPMTVLRWRAAG